MCGLEPPAVGKGPGFLNVEVSLARTVPDRKGDSNPRQRSLCQEPPTPRNSVSPWAVFSLRCPQASESW